MGLPVDYPRRRNLIWQAWQQKRRSLLPALLGNHRPQFGAGHLAQMIVPANFFCEPLPDAIDEPQGPIPDDELILVAVGRDHQFESGAGHLFR